MSYGYDESGYDGSQNQRGQSKSQRVQRSLQDYVDVPQRIAEFRQSYPEGSLQPQDPANPIQVIRIKAEHPVRDETGEVTGTEEREEVFLQYIALAYRTPDDTRPGIGVAWEIFPGLTTYTRRSEAMNAETSAWGRAIVAVLAADAKQSVATQQEIRNRQAEREAEERAAQAPQLEFLDEALNILAAAADKPQMYQAWVFAGTHRLHDAQIPSAAEGFRYRDAWAARRDELKRSEGLGEETQDPPAVAPAEDQPQDNPDADAAMSAAAQQAVAEGLDGTVVEQGEDGNA